MRSRRCVRAHGEEGGCIRAYDEEQELILETLEQKSTSHVKRIEDDFHVIITLKLNLCLDFRSKSLFDRLWVPVCNFCTFLNFCPFVQTTFSSSSILSDRNFCHDELRCGLFTK